MSTKASSKDSMRILLDTNVLLDYYLAERPNHDWAVKFITAAYKNNTDLLCAATSLKDFYYIYCLEVKRRSSDPTEKAAAVASAVAWSCVNNILEIVTIASLGQGDAVIAAKLRSLHEDFEDDLILATAMRSGCTHIATNDKQLRAHATIPALTCQELLALGEIVV